MFIISKIKDYYDYYQGVFGIDKKKVLKRNGYILFQKDEFYMSSHNYNVHVFAINNKMYFLIETKKGIFKPSKLLFKKLGISEWNASYMINKYKQGISTDINKIKRTPITYVINPRNMKKIDWENGSPILKTFSFHKLMTAKELYIEVETFLGYLIDNPEIPNKQTNNEKLLAHGFDKKKSFRHRI